MCFLPNELAAHEPICQEEKMECQFCAPHVMTRRDYVAHLHTIPVSILKAFCVLHTPLAGDKKVAPPAASKGKKRAREEQPEEEQKANLSPPAAANSDDADVAMEIDQPPQPPSSSAAAAAAAKSSKSDLSSLLASIVARFPAGSPTHDRVTSMLQRVLGNHSDSSIDGDMMDFLPNEDANMFDGIPMELGEFAGEPALGLRSPPPAASSSLAAQQALPHAPKFSLLNPSLSNDPADDDAVEDVADRPRKKAKVSHHRSLSKQKEVKDEDEKEDAPAAASPSRPKSRPTSRRKGSDSK
jgi:hypothetical protein